VKICMMDWTTVIEDDAIAERGRQVILELRSSGHDAMARVVEELTTRSYQLGTIESAYAEYTGGHIPVESMLQCLSDECFAL
jgi:hypothetical protein